MNLLQSAPIVWKPQNKLGLTHCPICGYKQPDNCSAAAAERGDVAFIFCRRPHLNRTALVGKQGHGGATFVLNPRERSITPATTSPHLTPRNPSPVQPEAQHADADHVNNVYSLLLEQLSLRQGHRAKLTLRGLTDAEVNRLGYVSAPRPGEAETIAEGLAKYGLRGVPGFYREAGRIKLRDLGSGIYVPVRDARRRVRGIQIRRDEGEPRYIWLSSNGKPEGCGPGAPVHFCRPERVRATGEALLTEGALKGAVISFFFNCGVAAVPGVSTFTEDFGERLKADFPELRRVVIAYDSDWKQKREVRRALFRLQATLRRADLRWSVRKFPDAYKGFDDYLAATVMREEGAA